MATPLFILNIAGPSSVTEITTKNTKDTKIGYLIFVSFMSFVVISGDCSDTCVGSTYV